MNQFFLKNIISPRQNPSQQQDEQSDFERLLQLCNSYGLNEQQTKQLIDEFKRGPYTKSGVNSVNQSMLSQTSMCENEDQPEHLHNQPQYKKDNLNILYQQQQHKQKQQNNFYQHQPQHQPYHQQQPSHEDMYQQSNQGSSTNRYYGYDNNDNCYNHQQNQNQNQQEQDDDQSLNEMTFNQQNNTLTAIQLYQRAGVNAGLNRKQVNTNQTKTLVQVNKYSDPNIMQLTQPALNKASKSSLSTKIQPQTQKLSSHQRLLSHQEPQNNSSPQHQVSKSSQNSHQNSHQHSFQTETQLNPLYVRQLIINFQLLEKESEMLKQHNQQLTIKNQQINKRGEMLKIDGQKIRRECEEMTIKGNRRQTEIQRLSTLLEAQKQKSQMLASMKNHDSEVIKGLKDSIIQLTQLIKEKDMQNNQLQNKMFTLYQKIEKQSLYNQNQNQEINYNVGSMSRGFNKVGSTKSLVTEDGQREEERSRVRQQDKSRVRQQERSRVREQKRQRQRTPNYGRRQLSELILNNMNTQQSQQLAPSQSSKQLVRGDISILKTGSNSSGNQQTYQQKQSLPQSLPQHQRQLQQQSKQNAFSGLEVEQRKKCRQVVEQCGSIKGSQEQSRKRGSSRVDIKKYKGMIQQLRNSYSNVGGMR